MTASPATQPLRIGAVGLGRAFTLMLPAFQQDPRVRLVAGADPIDVARRQFEKEFAAPAFESLEALCALPQVHAVYIASPHQFHAEHVRIAAASGKHVLVEKPMALSLDECTQMIESTRRAGVRLIVGHSHSFNRPIQRTREIIASGIYGAVKMINALNYTDFLYRPRRPEELDTAAGGGVIYSQAAHQIDVVRLLGGGRVACVNAHTGAWDTARPTEGAYSALLEFEGGAFASATYSGYGHFDSDALMGHIGEMGQVKNPADHGASRRRLQSLGSAAEETAMKAARNYGGSNYTPPAAAARPNAHQHFGHIVVSCEKADLRPDANSVTVYADDTVSVENLPPPGIPRAEVIDELVNAVLHGKPPVHSGEWARATLEVCLAMLASSKQGGGIRPRHQVALPQGQ